MSDASISDLSKAMEQLSVTSNKTSPSLSDMPIDVVGLIIERSKYREQLKLRKVSKSLREFIDKQKPSCKSINVDFWHGNVSIDFDGHRVMYTDHLDRYQDDKEEEESDYNYQLTIVIRDDFEKIALDDLASTLKNPKLQLEEFSVRFFIDKRKDVENYCAKFKCLLESLNHQVSTKVIDLKVSSTSFLLSFLPYLKPGFLENINLSFISPGPEINGGMDQIALLDQWKQSEELSLYSSLGGISMEYATHFKRFRIFQGHINDGMFSCIRDYLSKLDNFEQCTLWKLESDLVYQVLGAPVFRNPTEEIFHHPIPDSDYYLEFKKPTYYFDKVEIEKKKRETNR